MESNIMIKIFLTIASLLLFSHPSMLHANDTYLGTVSGNVFLHERADSIQMIKERVNVHLSEPKAHVTCKFWIRNYGDDKTVFVGFPNFHYTFFKKTGPISNFTCRINGENVSNISSVELKEYHKEDDKHPTYSRQWYKWSMKIGKNETVLIENEYDGDWGDNLCQNTFVYTIGTGASWDGPIVDGRVTFDHSDLFSTNVIIRKKQIAGQPRPEYYQDSVVYSFSNYTPNRTEELGIRMYQIFWRPIDDSKQNTCPYRDVETLEVIRKLKNELFAVHGYPFKDTTLLKYYGNRKWYRIDNSFDSTKFSDGDIGFLRNLDEIEKRINKLNEFRK